MFYLLIGLFEGIVIIEALLAYRTGLFSEKQAARKVWDSPVLPFMNHGGMWGDFLIVSPVVAWIIHHHGNSWNAWLGVIAFIVALLLGAFMFYGWTRGSKDAYDPFGINGHATFNGWIHFGYMVVCLTAILMFYFSNGVSPRAAFAVTFLLNVHVVIGTLQPEFYVWNRISSGRWIQLFTIIALLYGSFISLIRR